jgi:multicomponent Na+:H+ antiporter subunit D
MENLLILPLVVPLVTAAIALLLRRSRLAQRVLGVAGAAGLLAAGVALFVAVYREGILAAQMGDWPAPFGITLVADLFSAMMVVVAGIIGLGVAIYSVASIDARREAYGYYSLLHLLLMGVCGAFLTGDIFNLYVWFEVMLIASFVLLALGGERAQTEGAIKYVTLNLISSAFFLAAVGIIYGLAGTLNMADLSVRLGDVSPGIVTTVAMLLMVAFGIKAAAFPLFFWLPASYHTPPVAVSAVFAGLLTKVGVYALIRVFTLLFVQDVDYTHNLILIAAGLTMVTGVLGAVAQNEFRRLLAFHIVSQIGYMLMGLGLYTTLGLAGAMYYVIHNIFAKTNLFLVAGVVRFMRGTYDLKQLGGMLESFPLLAGLFLISALSLAGIPPLSGFFGKLALVRAGIEAESYVIVAVALAVSLLTLYSMTKIWNEAFWKQAPVPMMGPVPAGATGETRRGLSTMLIPIVGLASLTVAFGLFAGPIFDVMLSAAEQLADPGVYREAVLGGGP